MGPPQRFSLLPSELSGLVFAAMGKEVNGGPLTVLSALTRLDIDPWAEGARLSRIPKQAAVPALAILIALFPDDHRSTSKAHEIAPWPHAVCWRGKNELHTPPRLPPADPAHSRQAPRRGVYVATPSSKGRFSWLFISPFCSAPSC